MSVSEFLRSVSLFIATALAEILGCYLPYLFLRRSGSPWLLLPAALALAVFAWLLTLHPTAAGRTYAAYGGIYITIAVLWLWLIDGRQPDRWDLLGAGLCLLGAFVIIIGPRAR